MAWRDSRGRPREFIASLAHGIAILEALADHGSELDLSTLARLVEKPKPTTWRLVHTLVGLGYVRQDGATRRFALAPRILALGTCFESMDLKELATPLLRQLSAKVGETVNMAVHDGDNLIYIDRIKTSQVININLHVGSRLPLYNTSMGRVLLAYMPDAWIRQYLERLKNDHGAAPYIERGGVRLLAVLRTTRERSYAVNDQDLVPGLRSVASPIWDGVSETPVAAINIAVPSVRMSLADLRRRHVPALLTTAEAVSTALKLRAKRTTVQSRAGRLAHGR